MSLDPASFADALRTPLAALSQEMRLLRLHTPLGADALLVERLDGFEAIGEGGFRLAVTALSTDAHIELKRLLGQPVLIELLTGLSRDNYRPLHGHVTAAELLGSDGGLARYRLAVGPWLAFLAHRRDSFVFQGLTVPQIVDEVCNDYQGQGRLLPAWRWELHDEAAYKPRSLCIQYEESDLAFVERLLAEEGLFYWFEHRGEASADPFGAHTLVIADHNGAFKANAQAAVRFHRADATESEDTIQRLSALRQLTSTAVDLASWDYRSLGLRPAAASSARQNSLEAIDLSIVDVPGAYAWNDSEDGARYARLQLEALEARQKRFDLSGTVRSLAPGSTFVLTGYADLDRDRQAQGDDAARLAVVRVEHAARNNLAADHRAGLSDLFATAANEQGPLYRCRAQALRATIPWRPFLEDEHGLRLHPKPTVTGSQTAIVVGDAGVPLTSDRDHRIKVQFHWQRGARSHNRQEHPSGAENAPADAGAGTWVRVMTPVAGANWGGNFIPRIGQEVLVSFIEGDIDRPVITGAVYNGRGEPDSQANRSGASVGSSTANAPAWFPGAKDGHAHNAVFAGFKTQALSASQSGTGGFNALLFDDTPSEAGTRLSTTQYASRLQLGRLKYQVDNQRLQDRGHGLELATDASGAVRAGLGLLISADARPQAGSTQLDSREPITQLQQAKELAATLADTAQKHNAKLPGEAAPDKLAAIAALQASGQAMAATSTPSPRRGEGRGEGSGGQGTIPAWSAPLLAFSAPAGIALFTPADAVLSAGATLSLTAGQDINFAAQEASAVAVKDGISLFTAGRAASAGKPNQETGIRLHAASGSVSMQSQSDETRLSADKNVEVASTTAGVAIAAPNHVLMTAAGAYLKLEGGNIEVHAPGNVMFHASQKNLAGPASANTGFSLPHAGSLDLFNEAFTVINEKTGQTLAGVSYRIEDPSGQLLAQGLTDAAGNTERVRTAKSTALKLFISED